MNLLIAATCCQLRPSLLTWLRPRSAQENTHRLHCWLQWSLNKKWIKLNKTMFQQISIPHPPSFHHFGNLLAKKHVQQWHQKKFRQATLPATSQSFFGSRLQQHCQFHLCRAGFHLQLSAWQKWHERKGSGWIHMGFWGLALQFIQTYGAPGMFSTDTPRDSSKTTWFFI